MRLGLLHCVWPCLFFLSGCGSLNNIYWKNGIKGGGEVITVDAKQRHTFIFQDPHVQGQWRVCAEAAPDVFSAVATSAAGDVSLTGSLDTTNDGKSKDRQKTLGGSGSFSIAETAAVIGKTQTVNTIRESMYRTCERWLSGSLSKHQFIVQAARDQNMMLRILAVEQLTGAARTTSTAISAAATQAAVENNKEAINLSQQLATRAATSEKITEDNFGALLAVDPDGDICRNGGKVPAPDYPDGDNSKPPNNLDTINKWNECDRLFRNYKDAKAQSDRHNSQLTLALTAAGKAGAASSTALNSNLFGFSDEHKGRRSESHLTSVAKAVQEIVIRPSVDEPLMFCLAYLDSDPTIKTPVASDSKFVDATGKDSRVVAKCLDIMSARASADIKIRTGQTSFLSDDQRTPIETLQKPYADFKTELDRLIKGTDKNELAEWIGKVEAALGIVKGSNQSADRCKSTEGCLKYVIARDLYYDDFTISEGSQIAANRVLVQWKDSVG